MVSSSNVLTFAIVLLFRAENILNSVEKISDYERVMDPSCGSMKNRVRKIEQLPEKIHE